MQYTTNVEVYAKDAQESMPAIIFLKYFTQVEQELMYERGMSYLFQYNDK